MASFFLVLKHISSNMWMCKWFLKNATQIQHGRQKSTPKFFVGRKNFKTERLKLFKFYNHTPHNMEMCSWFFQGFTEIQNSRHGSISIFLRSQKLINLGRILVNFYYHIPRDMEMCMWFFKVLPKFKMAAMYDSLYKWVIIHLV